MEKIKKTFNPLVSIVIPVYNGSNFMKEAIDSALAQTYENIEIIVVNDGSTDNTNEIAKSYGDKIRYFSKENGGVATALNLALKEMRGEYFSWLSHDDVYYPNKIEKQINKLGEFEEEEERSNVILYSNFSIIDESSEILNENSNFQFSHEIKKLNNQIYSLFNGLVNGCTLLIPKKCFNEVGFFDENLRATQDYDLWVRMFPEYKIYFSKDTLIKSRVHNEQGSKKELSRSSELDLLWLKMIKIIPDNKKIEMSGSVFDFYYKTYRYVKLTNRSKKAEEYLYKKIKNLQKDLFKKSDIVVANMATFPARKESLAKVINDILPQVDILNIYLNEYKKVPEFLKDPKIKCVLADNSVGDLKDNGKFYFLDKVPNNSYYLTIDDDIFYPVDYVEKFIAKLKKYNNKVVVGVHGIIFHDHFLDFTKSRSTIHFSSALKIDLPVSVLGTGTIAFHRSLLSNLNLSFFEFCGMADLYFASYCKNNNISLLCINRKKEWLKPVNVEQEYNLWNEGLKSCDRQNKIIQENALWEFDRSLDNISDLKISVIIPFYNKIDWVIEAVQSVLGQTHQNFEVILINDNSTDDISGLESLISEDKRIILLNNKRDKGAGGARNTGIDYATGDFVAFLDADDLFLPEKLEKQLSFMVKNNYSFSHTPYILFDKNGVEKKIDFGSKDYFFPNVISGCSMATPTVMVDADLLKNPENRFPEKYLVGQDVCFWIKLSSITRACYVLKEYLSKVRRHDSNVAYTSSKQIQGLNNIFDYSVTNFLSGDSVSFIKEINEKLLRKINENFSSDKIVLSNDLINQQEKDCLKKEKKEGLREKIRKILFKIIWTFSPNFRMLTGNRNRMIKALDRIEKIENEMRLKNGDKKNK